MESKLIIYDIWRLQFDIFLGWQNLYVHWCSLPPQLTPGLCNVQLVPEGICAGLHDLHCFIELTNLIKSEQNHLQYRTHGVLAISMSANYNDSDWPSNSPTMNMEEGIVEYHSTQANRVSIISICFFPLAFLYVSAEILLHIGCWAVHFHWINCDSWRCTNPKSPLAWWPLTGWVLRY